MTDDRTPLARLADRSMWQGGNVGGIEWPNLPPASMIRAWEHKMSPADYDHNGRVRRAYRRTRGERLATQLTTGLAVVAFCAVVWWVVWGVMA